MGKWSIQSGRGWNNKKVVYNNRKDAGGNEEALDNKKMVTITEECPKQQRKMTRVME